MESIEKGLTAAVNETRLYLWSGDLDRDGDEAPARRAAA